MPLRGRPFFRKLLFSAFLLLAFALIIVDSYLTRYIATRDTSLVQRRSMAEAELLTRELSASPPGDLQRFASEADRVTGARVTIVNPTGMVLADSEHTPETMENHGDRPEVRQALRGGIGTSIRHSATLDRDFSYVARVFTYRGQPGFVLRLAVPMENMDDAVSEVRWRIFYTSGITAILALLLAYVFSNRISSRIARLQAFAEQLLQSREPAALIPEADDELGALSRSLNKMGLQLHDSMQRLRIESSQREAILASMVEGVLAVDHEMRILFCNESFAAAIGSRASRAEGLPMLSFIRDAALVSVLNEVLMTGEPLRRRVQLGAAGDRVFEAQAAPLFATERRGAVAILHDISELERLERVRIDFVANVSHELRTPLAAIQGYAETLLDGALEDATINRRFLETIKAHAIRLNNISADLLSLSELDSGTSPGVAGLLSLKALIATARQALESEARLRGVQIISDEVEDVEVWGYKLPLEQTIINLLDNAIKFNRPGGEVRISLLRSANYEAKLRISDTGLGIPHQDLSRIFERFYRVDKARSRQAGGTGLGLAIVKHAIELMNGRIEVESELGRGSAFTITLPADVAVRSV